MERQRRSQRLPLALALGLLWSSTARAETVGLVWRAPPNCPGLAAFVQEVVARTPNARLLPGSPDGRVFEVTVSGSQHGYTGRLHISDGGLTAPREIEGDTCGEVVSALALLTALAIDPNASSAPRPELQPTGNPAQAQATPGLLPSSDRSHAEPTAGPSTTVAPRSRTRWHGGGGARYSTTGWITPRPMPAVDVFFEAWPASQGPWSGTLRLAFGAGRASSARGRWKWYAAHLDLCPLRSSIGWFLLVQSCVGLQLGSFHGMASAPASPRPADTKTWVGATAAWGLVLEAQRFLAGLTGTLIVPLTRYRFVLQSPTTEIYDMPGLGASLVVSAGVRFF